MKANGSINILSRFFLGFFYRGFFFLHSFFSKKCQFTFLGNSDFPGTTAVFVILWSWGFFKCLVSLIFFVHKTLHDITASSNLTYFSQSLFQSYNDHFGGKCHARQKNITILWNMCSLKHLLVKRSCITF